MGRLQGFYIANNVFIGRHDPNKLLAWYYRPEVWSKYPGFPALITSEYAIKVYGQGHVVAYQLPSPTGMTASIFPPTARRRRIRI